MKRTREELEKEIIRLDQSNEEYANESKRKRQEFAKAFGWYKQGAYGSDSEPIIPSWEQIFIELGKLLAARTFMDSEDKISALELQVGKLLAEATESTHQR